MRPKTQGYPNETPDFKEGRALRDYQVECPSSHNCVSHCVSLTVSHYAVSPTDCHCGSHRLTVSLTVFSLSLPGGHLQVDDQQPPQGRQLHPG